MSLLSIRNLRASVEENRILQGLNLEIKRGEVHVIMGPNGSGKSTLAASIVGNPVFDVEAEQLDFDGEALLEMEVDERARAGIFLSFQVPEEISGLKIEEFLRTAKEARLGKKLPMLSFHQALMERMDRLQLPRDYAERGLNVGFSGGEKKKNEILQLATLEPKLAILDEADSGLDIDACKLVFEGLAKIHEERPEMGILIITHYNKVFEFIQPDIVHILMDGKIAKTGGMELVEHVEAYGYEKIKEERDGQG